MVNDDTGPEDEAEPTDEYYVPATFQLSREPGRIERILVGVFDEDGEIEARTASEDAAPDYYVPAMFQFSREPGRIERFIQALFEGGNEQDPPEFPEEFRDDFYLPAANPDGSRRLREQQHDRLIPASEASSERDEPDEPDT